MRAQLFEVVVRAAGEVRDQDGNLVSSEPGEARMQLTAEQVRDLGLTWPLGGPRDDLEERCIRT